jgi:hypothetical protein
MFAGIHVRTLRSAIQTPLEDIVCLKTPPVVSIARYALEGLRRIPFADPIDYVNRDVRAISVFDMILNASSIDV